MPELSIDKKQFITTGNESGLATDATVFCYFEEDAVVTGTYEGGEIASGQVVGKRLPNNRLALVFQCLTKDGALKSGQSEGFIATNEAGKLTLSFDWNWFNGDQSGGKSFYVEKE
jgi:hypothetical protein